MTEVRRPAPVSVRIPIEPHVADAAADAAALHVAVERVRRGGARAAVLGMNDGLVTNVCLILAVAGASATPSSVRLAGFASLVAGALSMAAGEWVSVRSQNELYLGLLASIRRLIGRNPQLMLGKVTDALEDEGFPRELAHRVGSELPVDEDRFLAFTARTVFNVSSEDPGSPVVAAVSSLALFSVGAFVPLAPWFFTSGNLGVALSVALTAVAGVAVGAWVARSAGTSAWESALRQLAIIIFAAAVTYGIGKLFGTAVA